MPGEPPSGMQERGGGPEPLPVLSPPSPPRAFPDTALGPQGVSRPFWQCAVSHLRVRAWGLGVSERVPSGPLTSHQGRDSGYPWCGCAGCVLGGWLATGMSGASAYAAVPLA